ncbi:MAG TPA: MerR family transcriptional regulator [Solirubrobacteraceae bacterium]
MEDASLTIGEVARRVGINASAIRYYERNGVLPEPDRVSGQRRYTQTTVDRLRVLDVAKRAGFSLDEAKVLLGTMDATQPAHAALQALAQAKLPEVEALVARAQTMRRWLQAATTCDCETLDVCALFADEPAA